MSDDSPRTSDVIRRFNEAFLRHAPAALDELIAEDCVIEGTQPAPNGNRYVGRAQCLANWQGIAAREDASFELEEVTVFDDRAIIRWRYRWGADDASSQRGVNLMRVRDGLIVEALGYVKGRQR